MQPHCTALHSEDSRRRPASSAMPPRRRTSWPMALTYLTLKGDRTLRLAGIESWTRRAALRRAAPRQTGPSRGLLEMAGSIPAGGRSVLHCGRPRPAPRRDMPRGWGRLIRPVLAGLSRPRAERIREGRCWLGYWAPGLGVSSRDMGSARLGRLASADPDVTNKKSISLPLYPALYPTPCLLSACYPPGLGRPGASLFTPWRGRRVARGRIPPLPPLLGLAGHRGKAF